MMVRGFVGFLIGVLVAAGLLRAIDSRRDEAGVKAAAATDAVPENAEESSLRAALAKVEAAIRELEGQAAAPVAAPEQAPGRKAPSTARLGHSLAAALKEDDWIWDSDDKRAQDFGFELQALLLAQAKELGIPVDEAEFGPDGLPALQLAMLEAFDPPPDAAARARMAEALTKLRERWDGYLSKRGGLTSMGRCAELLELSEEFEGAVDGVLSEDQQTARGYVETIWSSWRPASPLNRSLTMFVGPQSLTDISAQWTGVWSDRLRLNEGEARIIRPIVDDYVRGVAELNSQAARRKALDPNAPAATYREHLALMLQAQKRLADLGLTDEQRKVLDSWSDVISHELTADR